LLNQSVFLSPIQLEVYVLASRSNILEAMENDFMSRGYLLPKGCKDLMDAMKLKATFFTEGPEPSFDISKLEPQVFIFDPNHPPKPPTLPPIVGELVVPNPTTVSQLAALLGQKPFKIIADIMELGVFASVNHTLDFKIISSVARKYGYLAIKPA
jgi:hypothetical protein